MEMLTDPQVWAAFATLTLLEVILGIDNVIFLSIVANRVEPARQRLARNLGLAFAMVTRIVLLLSIAWLTKLTTDLFIVLDEGISWRDLVLMGGGIFLIWKSTREIYGTVEGAGDAPGDVPRKPLSMWSAIAQIGVIDIVFSFDSVITAIGMADQVEVMVAAIVVAIIVMMLAAGKIARFVEAHPSVKMLALAFLILIGVALIAEGLDRHLPKGYIYFAMAFSLLVEMLNMTFRKKQARRAMPEQ